MIDGLDGSGKATQAKLLAEYIRSIGRDVIELSFPDYGSDSSAAVKMYLSGEIGGDASKLNPYMCSSFYAIDRAIQYYKNWIQYYKNPDTYIICDRYLSANIIHQGSKIEDKRSRECFYDWVYEYEVGLLGIPREDITIFLDVPVSISQELMTKRYKGDNSKKDIHESNIEYLNQCRKSADQAIEYMKQNHDWVSIECAPDGTLLSKEEIFGRILKTLDDKGILNK